MIVNGFLIVEHLRLSDFGSAMYSVHDAGMSCHRVPQSEATSIMLLCNSRSLANRCLPMFSNLRNRSSTATHLLIVLIRSGGPPTTEMVFIQVRIKISHTSEWVILDEDGKS